MELRNEIRQSESHIAAFVRLAKEVVTGAKNEEGSIASIVFTYLGR
jgi:hypothetical protein